MTVLINIIDDERVIVQHREEKAWIDRDKHRK